MTARLRGITAREAALAEADPLAAHWHPVAWARDVGAEPHATVLLGRPLVLWRSTEGVHCFRDLCPHRGTALSLGHVDEGRLVCAYHGWGYGPSGRCEIMPQLEAGQLIPAGAQAAAFRCEERHGLVWVALSDPVGEIPDFPELREPGFRHAICPAYTWRTSAARMVENFTDFGHLGWLHDGLLGMKTDLVVPPHRVENLGAELRYELTMRVPRAEGVNDLAGDSGLMTNTYVLTLPHTIHLRSSYEATGKSRVLFFAVQPVAPGMSTGYCYQSRDFDLDGDDQPYIEFQEVLAEQDRPVVESQRPEELPLDIADELHLRFDRVAVEYRKALVAAGLPS